MSQPENQLRPTTVSTELIEKLKDELIDTRQVVMALTDLLYLQNQDLDRLRAPSPESSVRLHLKFIFRKLINKRPLSLQVPPTDNRAAQALQRDYEYYHPGIQIRLKKASLWCRYVTATSRRLRGKYHQKYEAYLAPTSSDDPAERNYAKALADHYSSILLQRGI